MNCCNYRILPNFYECQGNPNLQREPLLENNSGQEFQHKKFKCY